MGWTFAYDRSFGRKELIAELRSPRRFGPQTQLLQACATGNHHWYLAKTTKPTGEEVIWIGLDLMQGGGKTGGWGHKAMDESCGPCYYDCPISYLDKVSEPTGYAAAWRDEVRHLHALLAALPVPAPGLVITYGGHQYKLVDKAGSNRGWLADRVSDGYRFRLKARQITHALRNAP